MKLQRRPDGSTLIEVEVDDTTFAWLAGMAEMCHAPLGRVAGSILRDVRDDDDDQHIQEQMAAAPTFRVVGGTDTLN